jgi:hypothetical protein
MGARVWHTGHSWIFSSDGSGDFEVVVSIVVPGDRLASLIPSTRLDRSEWVKLQCGSPLNTG